MKQTTSKILMVRPASFGFNPQTAESNVFQKAIDLGAEEIAKMAAAEFDGMAAALRKLGVDVVVEEDSGDLETPDAVFPNNVFSTHPDGTICIYPMEAEARRLERVVVDRVVEMIANPRLYDLSRYEENEMYLEGTGSLVLDRANRIAFACLSTRTHPELVKIWAEEMGYETCIFDAVDESGTPIYHTNVMMCLGTEFAVACIESITDPNQRANFASKIHQTGRELVEISFKQMYSFAGNMIELAAKGGPVLAMSQTAKDSLTKNQIQILEKYCRLAAFKIDTIEQCGGGSVRCMIAEVF